MYPAATLSLGVSFPAPPGAGGGTDAGQFPTSLPLAAAVVMVVLVVVVVVVAATRPRCPRVPPHRSLRVLRAPAGPSHSSGYF